MRLTGTSWSAPLGVGAILLACSRSGADQRDSVGVTAIAPTKCAMAVVGSFIPTERSLASEAPVQRTIARLGLVYIAALNHCRINQGLLPTSGRALIADSHRLPAGTRCAIREAAQLKDEWGFDFVWAVRGDSLLLTSVGADGVVGSSDDITSPPAPGVSADTVDVRQFCNPAGVPDRR